MNITDVLTLTRPLIVYDVESTGVNTDTDRIVEIGFQAWYPDKPMKEYRTLVNPQVAICGEASKVHKITNELFKLCATCHDPMEAHVATMPEPHEFKAWPTFKQLAPHLLKGFVGCDFAGKNVRFDLRITASEFARAGFEWSYTSARIIDAERLEHLGEPRTLSALYEKHTGKRMEDAHQALADVRATTELIVAQLRKYQTIPRDLDLLHKAQWPEAWLDGKGCFKMVNGVATCSFGKHRGKSMRDVPSDYYEWLLKPTSEFPIDVKTLANNALKGIYPDDKEAK